MNHSLDLDIVNISSSICYTQLNANDPKPHSSGLCCPVAEMIGVTESNAWNTLSIQTCHITFSGFKKPTNLGKGSQGWESWAQDQSGLHSKNMSLKAAAATTEIMQPKDMQETYLGSLNPYNITGTWRHLCHCEPRLETKKLRQSRFCRQRRDQVEYEALSTGIGSLRQLTGATKFKLGFLTESTLRTKMHLAGFLAIPLL